MKAKNALKIILGVVLIALGARVIFLSGDFNVIVGSVIAILGAALFFVGDTGASSGKKAAQTGPAGEDLSDVSDEEPSDVSNQEPRTDAVKPKGQRGIWIVFLVGVLLFGVVQAVGLIGNWRSPEKKLTEAELLDTLSSANVVEMKGLLNSTNQFTYLYVDGERVGTVKEKGLWNMSWQYQNKGDVLYTMGYSDHMPVEDDFQTYEYTGKTSGVLGYGQTTLVDSQHMIYFYDANDKPVGYVDVETPYAFYRDNWTVCDMEGYAVYDVTADYNTLDKQLTYTITKYADSELNILQVMGIRFLTRDAIHDYYD